MIPLANSLKATLQSQLNTKNQGNSPMRVNSSPIRNKDGVMSEAVDDECIDFARAVSNEQYMAR